MVENLAPIIGTTFFICACICTYLGTYMNIIITYTYTYIDLNQIVQQLGVKEFELQKKVYADSVKVYIYMYMYSFISIQ
jgi:hypothetical protein